jgi:hypothetical protein
MANVYDEIPAGYSGWTWGDPEPAQYSNGNGARVGDVVQVIGGGVGIVLEIVDRVAKIAREDGTEEEQLVDRVVVVPPETEKKPDYMPWAIGAAALVFVALAMKK